MEGELGMDMFICSLSLFLSWASLGARMVIIRLMVCSIKKWLLRVVTTANIDRSVPACPSPQSGLEQCETSTIYSDFLLGGHWPAQPPSRL